MELIALLGIGMLTFVSAAGQHFYTVYSNGVGFVLTDRSQPLSSDGFAGRSARALRNTVESAAMYGPAVLVLLLLHAQNKVTAIAAATYLMARIGFLLAYWAGASRLRSVCWGLGMASIVATYLVAIAAASA